MAKVQLRDMGKGNKPTVAITPLRERQFVDLLMMGRTQAEAFCLAFPNVRPSHAQNRAMTLLNKEHIQEMIRQRMEKSGAGVDYVLIGLKREVETSEHPMSRVKALEILAKFNRMLEGGGGHVPTINVYLSRDDVERSDRDGTVESTATELPVEMPRLRDGDDAAPAAGPGQGDCAGDGAGVGG